MAADAAAAKAPLLDEEGQSVTDGRGGAGNDGVVQDTVPQDAAPQDGVGEEMCKYQTPSLRG